MTNRRATILGTILVGLIALSAVVYTYNRRAEQQMETELYVPKKTPITPEIELLQQYVRIDTSNPPGNEMPGAQFLAAQLAKAGVKYEIIESAPRRANLYARLKGKRPGEGLLLHNHIDVVPPGKGWEVPPFSGAIRINMLHGRGSIDMKSIALCQLEAFLEVARSGKQPERDIAFLATADEEEGSNHGMIWLLAHRPDLFEGMKYGITEGGVTEMVKEKVIYFGIEIGSKQLVTVDLMAKDEASLQRARIALEPYFRPRDPDRLLPGVRRFMRAIAPQRLDYREPLENVDATIAAGKFWLLPVSMRELMQNSVWARSIKQLPDGRATMNVSLTSLPDEDPDRRLQWLLDKMKPFGVTLDKIERKEGPSPISDERTPLFALIGRELRRELGDIPVGPEVLSLSTTDARFLRARGMTCYGLQPFPLDYFQSLSIHGANERVRLDWYMSGLRMMKGVVAEYAFGG